MLTSKPTLVTLLIYEVWIGLTRHTTHIRSVGFGIKWKMLFIVCLINTNNSFLDSNNNNNNYSLYKWITSELCVVCTLFAHYKSQLKIKNVCHMMHCHSGSQHTEHNTCIGKLTIFKITTFLNSLFLTTFLLETALFHAEFPIFHY